MHNVRFYEKREIILSQFRETVPTEGEGIKIKGRKGKVLSVETTDDQIVHVQVELLQNKPVEVPKKK